MSSIKSYFVNTDSFCVVPSSNAADGDWANYIWIASAEL
jgi:hypothetical protein